MNRLNLRCSCGAVVWNLNETSPPSGVCYICHCDDCQVFAHFTEHPERVLDANGGTEAYQLPASQVNISKGLEHLACIHVTSRRLLRWHCSICKTPVANTYNNSKLSFISIPLCGAIASERDEILNPSSGHVWTKFGKGDLSKLEKYSIPRILWRMISRIVRARVSGDYRNNLFFDKYSGEPISKPYSLSADERHDLDIKARAVL